MPSLISGFNLVRDFCQNAYQALESYNADMADALGGELPQQDLVEQVEVAAQEVLNPPEETKPTKVLKNYSYDSEENILTLEVETPDENGEKVTRNLVYQITSLKVKLKGKDPLEVLGVKTDLVMQSVMGHIARTFSELKNAHALLKTSEEGEEVKKFQFGLEENNQGSLRIENALHKDVGQVESSGSSYALESQTAIQQLLHMKSWTPLLRSVQQQRDIQEHKFNAECTSTMRIDVDKLEKATQAIYALKGEGQKAGELLKANLKRIEEQLKDFEKDLKEVNSLQLEYQDLFDNFMYIQDHPKYKFVASQVEVLEKSNELLVEKMDALKASHKAIKAILLFDATRNLEEQRSAPGKASIGGYLTSEWNTLLKENKLLEASSSEIKSKLSPLSEEELEAFSKEKLQPLMDTFTKNRNHLKTVRVSEV